MNLDPTSEKYNGWTNRETWAVKLHWDSNSADHDFFTNKAREHKKHNKSVHEFAKFLEDTAEDIHEAVFHPEAGGVQPNKEALMFVQDVGSLWRVNWVEIAKAYYDEVE